MPVSGWKSYDQHVCFPEPWANMRAGLKHVFCVQINERCNGRCAFLSMQKEATDDGVAELEGDPSFNRMMEELLEESGEQDGHAVKQRACRLWNFAGALSERRGCVGVLDPAGACSQCCLTMFDSTDLTKSRIDSHVSDRVCNIFLGFLRLTSPVGCMCQGPAHKLLPEGFVCSLPC